MSYPRLKTRYFEVDKNTGSDFVTLDIAVKHLVVAVFCPELPPDLQLYIERANLRPYEAAVNRFGIADFHFDETMLSSPGTRVIGSLGTLRNQTNNANNQCPCIVTYLEFT
ncbi:hypothetical protein [Pedobacter sp. JCM 36344]|uniref:hypothetical protein n=1 Tax=Pedobacter sp. JCM 36344 TaxID=3374280 RepID=UPI00397AA91C